MTNATTSFEKNEYNEDVRVTTTASGTVIRELVSIPAQDPVVAPSKKFNLLGFRRLFTKAERAAIEWAAVDRADQPIEHRQAAAALRSTLKDQEQAEFIDLTDPDTIEGVQTLEVMGLIGKGRAAEILSSDADQL
jgi:hypothetical protein